MLLMRSMWACCTRLGTGKPVSHEARLATWRFVYEPTQNSSDMPRSERRQEINARPESGGYPKGDAEVVDTEHDSEFDYAAICLDPKEDRKSMLDPSPAVIRKETPRFLILSTILSLILISTKR